MGQQLERVTLAVAQAMQEEQQQQAAALQLQPAQAVQQQQQQHQQQPPQLPDDVKMEDVQQWLTDNTLSSLMPGTRP
eukprot:CAMPEP_0179197610 /NCGR_PEP_ID=MMETSP0796-20121207/98273_1 /TAXON_ID=73915 /ORGANISM="Pyrodinium bahamense, Strain pbaha01" /LENGTH=76 /DNA_ID=CAMNT_0020902035 /DNA_START=1 /DNA_END=228 /DNA_ORIENTATION=+